MSDTMPPCADNGEQVGLEALAEAARIELARIYGSVWSPEHENAIQQDAGYVHLRPVIGAA